MSKRLALRAERLEWRAVEGEIVALDLCDHHYLAVNKAGATLWALLLQGTTRSELVAALIRMYAIDEDQAGGDVDRFLVSLRERKLVMDEA